MRFPFLRVCCQFSHAAPPRSKKYSCGSGCEPFRRSWRGCCDKHASHARVAMTLNRCSGCFLQAQHASLGCTYRIMLTHNVNHNMFLEHCTHAGHSKSSGKHVDNVGHSPPKKRKTIPHPNTPAPPNRKGPILALAPKRAGGC